MTVPHPPGATVNAREVTTPSAADIFDRPSLPQPSSVPARETLNQGSIAPPHSPDLASARAEAEAATAALTITRAKKHYSLYLLRWEDEETLVEELATWAYCLEEHFVQALETNREAVAVAHQFAVRVKRLSEESATLRRERQSGARGRKAA